MKSKDTETTMAGSAGAPADSLGTTMTDNIGAPADSLGTTMTDNIGTPTDSHEATTSDNLGAPADSLGTTTSDNLGTPTDGHEATTSDNLGTPTDGPDTKTVDIIVPCYNEAGNIDAFYDAVQAVTAGIEGYDFSYIFVDDGSTDDTLEMIREIATAAVADVTTVRYISFSRNFGKEAAMYAGLKTSSESRGGRGADYAVLIDADLQHPPELIREMIATIEETGCDSCAARRVSRKGEPKIRSIFARGFYKIMNRFSDIEIVDGAVDFRMMSRRMIRAILQMPETQRFSKGIFAWVGFDTRWIEFENVKRMSGESKWSIWGLAKYAIAGFLDFAEAPLKATGLMGGIISTGAAIYLIIELLKTLIVGKDVPGYESLICLLLFFGGMVIAILSVIGEYIGRMYLEAKRRPIYIEKENNIDE